MSESQLQEMQRALGNIEGMLKAHIDAQKGRDETVADHEKRLGTLEQWRFGLVLVVTCAGAVGGIVVKLLSKMG